MIQRTYGATSRTCVHTSTNVVSTFCSYGFFKILFKPIYILILSIFFISNSTLIFGLNNNNYSEYGTIPEVDIQLQPPRRWKASSDSLESIRESLGNYVAKEIAQQTPLLLNSLRNKKKTNSLIFNGKIVDE